MHGANADSQPRVGVCFSLDGSLSVLAVVYRRVEAGLSVFCVSDPLPAAGCKLPAVPRLSSSPCLLVSAACCWLPAQRRPFPFPSDDVSCIQICCLI